ncbi:hypothetical protein BGZ80_001769 [Entomortierella chlamydospora]|uniref:Uncharacterized protein n=1 Tax=Entomortierella chlamydospora TaxID=101097 RepID=A0A9P6N1I9_9FUNG|nr:hypothetical protein BGZ80_001769 [Entomortierella chlamydospora]
MKGSKWKPWTKLPESNLERAKNESTPKGTTKKPTTLPIPIESIDKRLLWGALEFEYPKTTLRISFIQANVMAALKASTNVDDTDETNETNGKLRDSLTYIPWIGKKNKGKPEMDGYDLEIDYKLTAVENFLWNKGL